MFCCDRGTIFRKFHKQIIYDEAPVFSNHLVNSLNKAICGNRLASLTSIINHDDSAIFKLSTPFAYNIVTNNVFYIHSVRSLMNLCCTIPFCCTILFCLQATNNTSQFTIGGRILLLLLVASLKEEDMETAGESIFTAMFT